MTYTSEIRYHTALKADVLRQTNRSTSYTPRRIIWATVGTQATSASLSASNTVVTLPSGSSYYLEASIGGVATGKSSTAELQFYDINAASYLGQSARLCINSSHGFETVQGRRVARALILDSDISTSISVALVIKGGTNYTNISFFCSTTGINGQPIGIPTLRIIEIPS